MHPRVMHLPGGFRTFVTGVACALMVFACGEGDPVEPPSEPDPPAPTTGAVRVSVTTQGPRQDADGYVVTVSANTQNVASNGTVTFADVQPGTHVIELGGFAANCPEPMESSKTISVTAGATTDVDFMVVCGYLAYTANVVSMDVSVLETASFGVVETVPLPSRPIRIVSAPDGEHVYVSNAPDLTVIETATNSVTGSVSLATPFALGVSPDGSEVYVTDSSTDEVTVVTTESLNVVATILVQAGSHVYEPVFGAGGAFAYVSNRSANSVSVIDTGTREVAAHLTVGDLPTWLTVSPDGARVYSVNSDDLSVIDTNTNSVIANIPLGTGPAGEAVVTPDGAFVYVLDLLDEEVWVIDAGSNSVLDRIPVGAGALRMAMSPDGSNVYVVDRTNEGVTVISTATRQVVESVALGVAPSTVDFTADGSLALTANFDTDGVSVIDASDHALLMTVPVGDGPVWIAVTPN